jgi:hypothetical protein
MPSPPVRLLRSLVLLAGLCVFTSTAVYADATSDSPPANAGFEIDADKDRWPDGWPAASPGVTWELDAGNHFLRLTNQRPGDTIAFGRALPLPPDADKIEIRWRQRITHLSVGVRPGQYAGIAMEFLDANGAALPPELTTPSYQRNSTGWESKRGRFAVPAGAHSFKFTPALVRVDSGIYDLDDITLAPSDTAVAPPTVAATPSVAIAATAPRSSTYTPSAAGAPPELHVQGNRLVTVKGGREVWLQGLNVPSLEWSVKGENILRSIETAIDQWHANVIRLPVKADYWFGRGTKHNTQKDGGVAYRTLVDQAVALVSSKGAYLVLDLHHYRAPRPNDLDFWTDAATRYKNNPAVLFDLLNEPHGTTWEIWRDGGFLEEKKKPGDEDTFLTEVEKLHNKRGYESPGMQKMLDTVRSTGARNIVVIGGLDYAYDLSGINNGFALTDKSGNGIMYASHIYPWKRSWQKKVLDVAAKHPILLGEVGGDVKKMNFIPANQQENVETWAPAMLGVIQKYKLNWTGWCFHPKATPRMILDWDYTPTPFWGQLAKDALGGKPFPPPDRLR